MSYNHHYYEEISLPPNIINGNPKLAQYFHIKIIKLIYLNQKSKQLNAKVCWWGYQSSPTIQIQQQTRLSYPIYSTVTKFLSYCLDMKVLRIQLYPANKNQATLCQGALNWQLLKGWSGQPFKSIINLISNKKKIGELQVQIEIQSKVIIQQSQKKPIGPQKKPIIHNISNHNSNRSHSYNEPKSPQIDVSDQQSKRSYNDSDYISKHSHSHHGNKSTKKGQHEITSQCICKKYTNNDFHREIITLRQEYQLLFGKIVTQQSEDIQTIEVQLIEIICIDNKAAVSKSDYYAQIVFPLPGGKNNVYRFNNQKRSIIKIVIDNKEYKIEDLKKYVQTGQIRITCQYGSGTVLLKDVLSQCGREIIVPLFIQQKKNKKNAGLATIKIIPPEQNKEQRENNVDRNSEKQSKDQKQAVQKKQTKYIWMYFGVFTPLNLTYFTNSNMFLRISQGEFIFESETFWKQSSPKFNFTATLQQGAYYDIEIWDRQKKIIKVGQIHLKNQEFKNWEQTIPVFYRGQVIGYLSICSGRGNLLDANKYLQIHNKKNQTYQKPQQIQEKKQDQQSNDNKQEQENERKSQEQHQNTQKQNIIDSSNHQQSIQQESQNRSYNQSLQALSILDIHNLVYTELFLQQIEEKNIQKSMSLSKFQQQFQKKLSTWAISKLASQYLEQNRINSQKFISGFKAFKVYYTEIQQYRDETLKQLSEIMNNEGLTINMLEIALIGKYKRQLWGGLQQILTNNPIVEKLRIYYEKNKIQNFCDSLRKFSVYQNTFGELIPSQQLQQFIKSSIYQLLDISDDSIISKRQLNQQIKQYGIQLSHWEQLNIFDELPPNSQSDQPKPNIIKCPTFGLLGSQNMPKNINRYEPGFIQQISPIYEQTIKLIFSNLCYPIQEIHINGTAIKIKQKIMNSNVNKGQITLKGIKKNFRYEIKLLLEDLQLYELQGSHNEWISMIDKEGSYAGCIKIVSD